VRCRSHAVLDFTPSECSTRPPGTATSSALWPPARHDRKASGCGSRGRSSSRGRRPLGLRPDPLPLPRAREPAARTTSRWLSACSPQLDGLTNLAIAEGQSAASPAWWERHGGNGQRDRRATRHRPSPRHVNWSPRSISASRPSPSLPPKARDTGQASTPPHPTRTRRGCERRRRLTQAELLARAPDAGPDPDVRMVLERGIHDIAGEVRNSLDFHRSQDGGEMVTRSFSAARHSISRFRRGAPVSAAGGRRPADVSLADQSLAASSAVIASQ